jgi:hypothetical protein
MAENLAVTGTRRIAFATKDARGFVSLRGAMLAEATRRRHAVLCLAPAFDASVAAVLGRIGVRLQAVTIEAQGYNPFASYRIKTEMAGHIAAFGPHTLAIADLDLMPLMVMAAERAKVTHIVPMTAHVPNTFDKAQRKAFEAAKAMIVETPDAARGVAMAGVLKIGVPVIVMPASGIDLKRAMAQPMPPIGEGLTFLHVVAADDRKARAVFAAASQVVKPRSPLARFIEADIDDLAAITAAHVIVHTGEQAGLAPSLLAGLAAGRPLITSDVAGARDAVDERVNGCRFQPGDAGALAEAMLSFLRRPHEITAMARASRAKAERRFDLDVVNRVTLDALGLGESFAAAA